MAEITQAALARELGVSRNTIHYHVKRGLTFDQIRELVGALKKCRQIGSDDDEDDDDDDDDDDEQEDENNIIFLRKEKLRREITLKEVQAEQAQVKLAREKNKLVDMDDVNELMVHIASVTKSVFQSLENKLPGKIEGLTASEMVPVLRDEINASLISIADEIRAIIKTLNQHD